MGLVTDDTVNHVRAEYDFVFLSSVLHEHVGELFSGMKVLGCYQFRLTRNSDLFVDEEEVKDLRTALISTSISSDSAPVR